MNMLRRQLYRSTRQRLNLVLVVTALSLFCCFCGGLMAFVIAPGQAIQASRIARMPQMDAEMVRDAAAGDPLLISGTLAGNTPLLNHTDLVAYREDQWLVTVPSASDADPSGRWQTVRTVVPQLTFTVNDQSLTILGAEDVRLGGPLHEVILTTDSPTRAAFEGESLPDGTQRFQGFRNGDVITILGSKASTGDIIPEQLFLGDRVSFVESQRNAASALLYSGLCMMLLSPIILVGGLLYATFGRHR